MEMDFNLKTLVNFLKFSLCVLEKLLKTDLKFVLHLRSHLIFSSRCYTKNFMLAKRFYVRL